MLRIRSNLVQRGAKWLAQCRLHWHAWFNWGTVRVKRKALADRRQGSRKSTMAITIKTGGRSIRERTARSNQGTCPDTHRLTGCGKAGPNKVLRLPLWEGAALPGIELGLHMCIVYHDLSLCHHRTRFGRMQSGRGPHCQMDCH